MRSRVRIPPNPPIEPFITDPGLFLTAARRSLSIKAVPKPVSLGCHCGFGRVFVVVAESPLGEHLSVEPWATAGRLFACSSSAPTRAFGRNCVRKPFADRRCRPVGASQSAEGVPARVHAVSGPWLPADRVQAPSATPFLPITYGRPVNPASNALWIGMLAAYQWCDTDCVALHQCLSPACCLMRANVGKSMRPGERHVGPAGFDDECLAYCILCPASLNNAAKVPSQNIRTSSLVFLAFYPSQLTSIS